MLEQTGKSPDELRDYVEQHRELKQALYKVPHRKGIAGTAAQFAWYKDSMTRIQPYRRTRVAIPARQVA